MLNSKGLLAGATIVIGLGAATATTEAAWWNLAREAPGTTDEPVRLAQSMDADRLNRVEAQMRTLTGQIDELSFQLRQLEDQLRRAQEDTDYRLRTLEGGGGQPQQIGEAGSPRQVGAGAPLAASPQVDSIGTIAGQPDNMSVNDGTVLGAPPQPLGTLVIGSEPPADGQPLDLSALARRGAASESPALSDETAPGGVVPQQVVAIEPSGDPRTDYSRAYNLIVSGKFEAAEQSFRQFLAAYPGDEAAPDAQYWLGESYFARGRFGDAAEAFRMGYKAYPKSSRAPDTLLKLGLSLAGLGERDAACQIYAQVLKQYPEMSNALHQRVVTEQASASC